MLASKMEILTCYQAESCKKFGKLLYHQSLYVSLSSEKRLAAVEMEHKVTRRHLRQLRKKLSGEIYLCVTYVCYVCSQIMRHCAGKRNHVNGGL